jgi:uncharacterized protein YegJ (DUF2314 family)
MPVGAALLWLAAPVAAAVAVQDETVSIPSGDIEMLAAISSARGGLPVFFGHATSPGPGEHGFMVKYDIVPEDKAEYVWAEIIAHRGGLTTGRLVNAPNDRRLKRGDEVTIRDTQVIDWAYWRDGTLQGGATMRVLIGRMEPAEAKAMLDRFGW